MLKSSFFNRFRVPSVLFLILLLLLSGCADSSGPESSASVDREEILQPSAPGTDVFCVGSLQLDLSNKNEGYITAIIDDEGRRINLQITDPAGTLNSYFVSPGESAVIPFSGGDGTYLIFGYEQISGDQYAAICSQNIEIELRNPFLPFLYPNQYVSFTPDAKACLLARELTGESASDLEALGAIYEYVISHITYDTEKAASVAAGYLPDIDETLETGTGICFDYAALMTAMLRSLHIPCKLQIGYAGTIKHSWIDVYMEDTGWVYGAITFDGKEWKLMDPTFESNSSDSELIEAYIADTDHYMLQSSH